MAGEPRERLRWAGIVAFALSVAPVCWLIAGGASPDLTAARRLAATFGAAALVCLVLQACLVLGGRRWFLAAPAETENARHQRDRADDEERDEHGWRDGLGRDAERRGGDGPDHDEQARRQHKPALRHRFDLPLTNRELAAFLARREGGEGRR